MKRIAIIAVLFVFPVNNPGYCIVFRQDQYLIKKDMVTGFRPGNFL